MRLFLYIVLICTCVLCLSSSTLFAGNPPEKTVSEEFVISPARPLNLDQITQKIRYPRLLEAQGVEGKITCYIKVSETGEYVDHRLRQTSDHRMVLAVIRHLPDLEFKPAQLGKEMVPQWVTLTFSFQTPE